MTEREIFVAAQQLSNDAERKAYLDQACGDDAELRARIEELLREHEQLGSFLEKAAPLGRTVDEPSSPRSPGALEPGTVKAGDALAGRYKLLERLGEGGMGAVWMAQQTEPVKRLVAIKLIKAGMDSKQVLARFEAERQALAVMDHPNIAKVHDAGTTPEGKPFFVMELVKGVPITKYCDEHHLTPRQRLELFVPLCQAIQHAHQKGIIHRDLKPSNVLIALFDGRPVPKIIDFGVAKAAGQPLTERTLVTGFGAIVGTLEYMSPEQAELNNQDIDTRSDIYSLGVLLYELLTGTTPLSRERLKQAAFTEMLRIIREEDPPKPSTRLSDSKDSLPAISAQRHTEPATLTRLVRGELDWIVMKALEKDRNRRYETANGFAMDLQRYLADEPVQACPPSAWYRWGKFRRRHRHAVVVALALILGVLSTIVVLAISTVIISGERAEVVRQKNQAEENFRMAKEAIDSFFTKVSESDLFDQPGAQPLRKQLLEDARKFYERILEQQKDVPGYRAELAASYFRLWQIHYATGRFVDSMAALDKGLDLAGQLYRENPDDLELFKRLAAFRLGTLSLHYLILTPNGSWNDAIYQKAARFWEPLAQRFPHEPGFQMALAEVYADIANIWRQDGSPGTRALAMHQRAYDLYQKALRGHPTVSEYQDSFANAQVFQGNFLYNIGRFEEAEKLIRAGINSLERLSAQSPATVRYRVAIGRSYVRLFNLYITAGRYEEADKPFVEVRDRVEQLVREFPKSLGYLEWVASCRQERATFFRVLGKRPEAETEARQAVALFGKLVAAFPGEVYEYRLADSQVTLGTVLTAAGQFGEARQTFRDAVAVYEKPGVQAFVLDSDWISGLSNCYKNLASALKTAGEAREAEQTIYRAAEFFERLTSARDDSAVEREAAKWQLEASKLPGKDGKQQQALQSRARAVAGWKKLLERNPASDGQRWILTQSQRELAQAFSADPKLAKEAEELYRRAVAILEKLASDHPGDPNYRRDLGHTMRSLGSLLQDCGRRAEAISAFQKALELFETLAREYPEETEFLVHLTDTLVVAAQERVGEAYDDCRRIVETYAKVPARSLEDASRQAQFAAAFNKLIRIARSTGKPEKTAALLQQILDFYEHLVAEWPNEVAFQKEMATRYLELSRVLRETGKHQEADKALSQTFAISAKLLQRKPTSKDGRYELATVYRDLAREFLADPKRTKEAEKGFRQAGLILEKLAADYPDTPHYLHLAADSLVNLAHALRAANRPKEAEQAYRQGITLLTKLVAQFPKEQDFPSYLGWARAYLASFLIDNKRPAEAEAEYRKALAGAEKAAADFPDNANSAELIGHRTLHLGWHLMSVNQHAEAERVFLKGAHTCDENARRLPSVPILLWFAAVTRGNAASAIAAQKRAGDAELQYRKTVEVLLALPGDFYKVASRPQEADQWFTRRIALLRSAGDNQDAAVFLRQVIEFYRKLRANPPTEPAIRKEMANRYLELSKLLLETGKQEDWAEAIEALHRSTDMKNGGEACDWFFLSIAQWKLDQKTNARASYDRAVEWMEKNAPKNEELSRLRTEAQQALEIKKQP